MKIKQLIINKKTLSILTGLFILITPSLSKADVTTLGENEVKYTKVNTITNPVKEYYSVKKLPSKNKEKYINERYNARQIWDMVEVNGKIYIASGDYNNENKIREVPMLYYNEKTHRFEKQDYYTEQAIIRFNEINGKVYVPGIDKTGSWDSANYYTIDENGVHKYETIPNAAHVFDIEEYNGMLFAACGVEKNKGYSPIKISYDNGETWEECNFEFNERYNSTTCRVYDLFKVNGKLYAIRNYTTLLREFYIFDEETKTFKIFKDKNNIPFTSPYSSSGITFSEKAYYNGYTLLNTESELYYGSAINNFKKLNKLEGLIISDFQIRDGVLYILTNKELENGKYEISVYSTTDFENFNQEVLFKYNALARSFSYSTNSKEYLFGIGDEDADSRSETNGNIVRISKK